MNERQSREKQFWDQHYFPGAYAGWREQSYESWRNYRALQQTALDFLGPIAGRRLLMCGVGVEAIIFARAGAEVYGFDISETQISAIKKLAQELDLAGCVQVAAMAFEEMDYASDSFDLAYGHAILHHIDLPEGAAQLHRVLRKGGRASFIEPLGMNPLLEFARRSLPYREKSRTPDEKPLTYSDIQMFVSRFGVSEWREFSLLAMLRRRVIRNRAAIDFLEKGDRFLLHRLRFLRRFCSEIWIGVQKSDA